MSKPKVAFYWCASCGGCEETVVDLAEDIVKVIESVDIVFWPVAMDFKKDDVEKLADNSLTATFINGAIRTSEQQEMCYLLRRKSKLIISFGSCACFGGIPSLANQFERDEILKYVYEEAPSVENNSKTRPQIKSQDNEYQLQLPEFHNIVRALDEVIEVDYYLPGCPPTPNLVKETIETLLGTKLPPKGFNFAPDIALCQDCPRKDSKPKDLSIIEFKRPSQVIMDPEKCFLSQGIICLGPATRKGCEALCINGNMPCTGCFGPTSKARDYGAKALSAMASILDAKDEKEIEKGLSQVLDPLGTFYKYGLSKFLLRGKVNRRS